MQSKYGWANNNEGTENYVIFYTFGLLSSYAPEKIE